MKHGRELGLIVLIALAAMIGIAFGPPSQELSHDPSLANHPGPLRKYIFAMPVEDQEQCRGVSTQGAIYVPWELMQEWNPPMHGGELHRLMWFVAYTDHFTGQRIPTIFQVDRTHKWFAKWDWETLDAAGTLIHPDDIVYKANGQPAVFFEWMDQYDSDGNLVREGAAWWFYREYGVCRPW